MIGKTLVHYEITAEIGKGGMGEVYQAKDTKLGRDVAIKILPEEFATDPDRVTRFQREAKLLASLNHPNIAAIYGLEESDDTHFLVMELIEGDTLRDRIKSGPIPVEEALKLALQMAEALEAAHEKGVIHRDLKPANIKVTPDSKVKILDFGLAKAYAGDQESTTPLDSPTISAAATQQGVILGTAAYMSPEQARGKPVDKRADIWAFGVVLYEMLTGRAAFQGEDVSVTLASVITSDANLTLLPPNIHPRVREVVKRCLQKEPKKRYSGISDAQYEIEQVLEDPSGILVEAVTTVKPKKKLRVGLSWVAGALILGLIIAGVAVWYLKPKPEPEPLHVIRLDYDLPEDQEFNEGSINSVAVSADGTKIVYVANNQLYLKDLNEFTARPVQGTDEYPAFPFFSPDGQWIGYSSLDDNQLKKISIMGGTPIRICEDTLALGPTWENNDMIVFGYQGRIMRVSANGGTPEEILKGDVNEWFFSPQILPDGKSVLFSTSIGGEVQVAVQSFESEERKELFPGGPARYLPTGLIVYGLENNLTAVRFNLETLETIGGPVPLIEGVYRVDPAYTTQSAISDSGTLVYIPGRTGTGNIPGTLVWVDREGREEPLEGEPKDYGELKISPDGKRVAFEINEDGNADIYIYDLVRGTTMRLTFNEAADYDPIWTPDGQRIIFGSDREGTASIYWKAADGTGKVEQIAAMEGSNIWPHSISNDGNTLFFWQFIGSSLNNIGMVSMEGERTHELLLQEEYREIFPQISPDGRWLAYDSNESGQYEVFVRPFPDVDSGGKWQVSTDGGRYSLWSPDGSELFYAIRHSDGELSLMSVSVDTDPTFTLGTPTILFSGPYLGKDIDPDGRRFLMIKETEVSEEDPTQGRPRRINIVVNWFEELKQRVPMD